MDRSKHFRSDEGTAGDDAFERDHFAYLGRTEGAGVAVLLSERAAQTDVICRASAVLHG